MARSLLFKLVLLCGFFTLALAPAAGAEADGRGFLNNNDKITTNTGFVLIVAFPLFIFLASMAQRALEKRKEARTAAEKEFAGQWRGGW